MVQSRNFSEMLEASIRRYQNRAITSAEVIQELINLAKEMSEASRRGVDLGLTEDELAFYDALEVNDSAVQVLGDETLKTIAQELVKAIPPQRHHRLDRAGSGAGQAAGDGEATAEEVWLSAR